MSRTVPFLNFCISFVAFITALSLVVYMLVSFVTGTYDVALQILDTIFLTPAERQSVLNGLNIEFLHTIALLIILMKAYRILVEYMRYYHINIKYMLEIGIIASVLELLFNYQSYNPEMLYIFLGLAVSFSFIYAFRHDVLLKATSDSQKEMEEWRAKVAQKPVTTVEECEDIIAAAEAETEVAVTPKPRKRAAVKKTAKKAVKKTTRKA